MNEQPTRHLIAAVLNLGYALQALTDQVDSSEGDHIRQDSSEHLEEINLLTDLIRRLL